MKQLLLVAATVGVSLLMSLVQQEVWGWCPVLAKRLIRVAARLMPLEHRDRYREEWLAEVEAFEGRNLSMVVMATRILLCAPSTGLALQSGMARQGLRLRMAAGALALLPRFGDRLPSRALRDFWYDFKSDVVVMTTEYQVYLPTEEKSDRAGLPDNTHEVSFDRDQILAAKAPSSYFLSYGMAMALSRLHYFLARRLRSQVRIIGDKGSAQLRGDESLIVLGSPANNRYLQTHFRDLEKKYPLLNRFKWHNSEHGLVLTVPEGYQLVPSIDDSETGRDFALVACLPPESAAQKPLIIVSGCNMWGVDGATEFLLNRNRLKALPRRTRSRRACPFAFILAITVSNGNTESIELRDRGDGSVVYELDRAEAC